MPFVMYYIYLNVWAIPTNRVYRLYDNNSLDPNFFVDDLQQTLIVVLSGCVPPCRLAWCANIVLAQWGSNLLCLTTTPG